MESKIFYILLNNGTRYRFIDCQYETKGAFLIVSGIETYKICIFDIKNIY